VGKCSTWWSPCRTQVAPSVQRRKVWLTPTTGGPCSNTTKTRNPLKFAGVPQTNETISAASGPKFTILWGHVEKILLLKNFFRLSIRAVIAKDITAVTSSLAVVNVMLCFTVRCKVYRAATLEWYNRHVTHQQLTSTCWRRFFTMRDCRILYIVHVHWVSRSCLVILSSILFHYNEIFHFKHQWNLFLVSTLVGVQSTWQSGKSTSNGIAK